MKKRRKKKNINIDEEAGDWANTTTMILYFGVPLVFIPLGFIINSEFLINAALIIKALGVLFVIVARIIYRYNEELHDLMCMIIICALLFYGVIVIPAMDFFNYIERLLGDLY